MRAKKFLIGYLAFFSTMIAYADLDSMKARVPQIIELKEKGWIGEQPDGFLGVVKNEPGVQEVVNAENSDRREEYRKRASNQGQTLDVLAKVLGEARIRQEKSGRLIQDTDGVWKKK